MNTFNWRLTIREKYLVAVILVLIGLLFVNQPIQAAHEAQLIQYSDQKLFDLFESSYNNGKVTESLVYLYAYIQRNPAAYANNKTYAGKVDRVYYDLLNRAKGNEYTANQVNANLELCNKFQCNDKASSDSTFIQAFPANMVKVCEGSNFSGKCSILEVGAYTKWQSLGVRNDSISSIQVGKNVDLTLCVHSLQHTQECITFKGGSRDTNLKSNYVPKGYSIDNNVSTARVTIKPIPGITTP